MSDSWVIEYVGISPKSTMDHIYPHSRVALRDSGEEKFPNWTEFRHCILSSTLLWREKGPVVRIGIQRFIDSSEWPG